MHKVNKTTSPSSGVYKRQRMNSIMLKQNSR